MELLREYYYLSRSYFQSTLEIPSAMILSLVLHVALWFPSFLIEEVYLQFGLLLFSLACTMKYFSTTKDYQLFNSEEPKDPNKLARVTKMTLREVDANNQEIQRSYYRVRQWKPSPFFEYLFIMFSPLQVLIMILLTDELSQDSFFCIILLYLGLPFVLYILLSVFQTQKIDSEIIFDELNTTEKLFEEKNARRVCISTSTRPRANPPPIHPTQPIQPTHRTAPKFSTFTPGGY
eukprot:TRINITY_DN22845_c0_g1_i1.p1 TRINITY_DN22845_c0_g1~~TRINITY_DN22845_c0_g1_i1.p1  ORF type:complete len:234 (+),score=43.17 TRINITY_DN22845_c0_g1_i1:72-773(+)